MNRLLVWGALFTTTATVSFVTNGYCLDGIKTIPTHFPSKSVTLID
ncbi:hypothetical protein ACQKL0_11245 [Peribacillus sp. NPDC097264]